MTCSAGKSDKGSQKRLEPLAGLGVLLPFAVAGGCWSSSAVVVNGRHARKCV